MESLPFACAIAEDDPSASAATAMRGRTVSPRRRLEAAAIALRPASVPPGGGDKSQRRQRDANRPGPLDGGKHLIAEHRT